MSEEARLEAARKQQRVFNLIQSTWTYYGDYHDRKEQLAYAATALYLTAATALVTISPAFWKNYSPRHVAGFGLLLVLTALSVGAFVYWQLVRRRWAADMGSACATTLADWNPASLGEDDLKGEPIRPPFGAATRGSVNYPAIVKRAFEKNEKDHLWPWLPREVTLGLMSLWTVAAGWRVCTEWGGVMVGVNWWSAVGLIFDIIGALGLAFSLQWFSRGKTGTQPWELPKKVRWALGVSAVLVALGFALQFLGQFPSWTGESVAL